MRSWHLSVQNCRRWEGPYNEASTREDRGSFGWETIGNVRVTIIVIVQISIRIKESTYTDTSVLAGKTYYYVVKTKCGNAESEPSNRNESRRPLQRKKGKKMSTQQ